MSGARHRPFLGISGIVLFICMFLPAVKTCDRPTYPTEMPMFLPPYILGLAFALGALAFTPRLVRIVVVSVRVTILAFCLFTLGLLFVSFPLGLLELCIAIALLSAIGVSGYDERRLAMTAIVAGSLQTIWFGMLAIPPDGMIGGQLSLLASIGLVVGGALWRASVPRPPPALVPTEFPRARVVER